MSIPQPLTRKQLPRVLEITDMIINRDHRDIDDHSQRMDAARQSSDCDDGRKIIHLYPGEKKKKLTVKNLLDQFEKASGEEFQQ